LVGCIRDLKFLKGCKGLEELWKVVAFFFLCSVRLRIRGDMV